MLLNLREYHRPLPEGGRRGLDRVLELLARPDIHTAPLAGGDALLGAAVPDVEAVVDLQSLGLDAISLDGELFALRLGAMATRAALSADAQVQTPFSGLIAQAARRWRGNIQRNRATLGGAIAIAASDDPLVAVLLACNAAVVLYAQDGEQILALADYLPQRTRLLSAPAIITEVIVPLPEAPTCAALATVARTPADAPIVLAVATLTIRETICVDARLALGGVAETPLLAPQVSALLKDRPLTPDLIADAASSLAAQTHPAGDYKGSAEYRRAMVEVLSRRALNQAWALC